MQCIYNLFVHKSGTPSRGVSHQMQELHLKNCTVMYFKYESFVNSFMENINKTNDYTFSLIICIIYYVVPVFIKHPSSWFKQFNTALHHNDRIYPQWWYTINSLILYSEVIIGLKKLILVLICLNMYHNNSYDISLFKHTSIIYQ